MDRGPMQLVVFGFGDGPVDPEVRTQISKAITSDAVNLVDAMFLRKSPDGDTTVLELEELTDDPEIVAMSEALSGGVEFMSVDDASELGDSLEPGHGALALLIEHAWMTPVLQAVHQSDGALLIDLPIPHEVVTEVAEAVEAL